MSEEPKPEPSPRRKVGYASPPLETRWKKRGPSPNPLGRPKKNKPPRLMPSGPDAHLHLLVLEEGNRLVTVNENGEREEIPAIVAIVRQLRVSAHKGNVRAQLKFVEFYQQGEQQRLKDTRSLVETILEFKKRLHAELERAKRSGLEPPVMAPHPDDIDIDMGNGKVRFNGPRDLAEKAHWDDADGVKKDAGRIIRDLRTELRRHPDERDRIEVEIQKEKERIEFVDGLYPPEIVRRTPGFDLEKWRVQHGH